MNDEALHDLWMKATQDGYQDDIVSFHKLLRNNPEAFNDAYGMFKEGGYTDDEETFKNLIGLSKSLQQNKEEKFLLDLPGIIENQQPQSPSKYIDMNAEPTKESLEEQDQNQENVKSYLEGEDTLSNTQLSANAFRNMITTLSGWDNRMLKVHYAAEGDFAKMRAEDVVLNKLKDKIKPVVEPTDVYDAFTDGDITGDDFLKVGPAILNALTGIGTSAIQMAAGRVAGGVVGAGVGAVGGALGGPVGVAGGALSGLRIGSQIGGRAAIASDMISTSLIEYNTIKAQELGISYEELVKSGQSEILIPASLGVLQAELESWGLGKITKAIMKKAGTGFMKNFMQFTLIGTQNGGQELGQELASLTNEEAARISGQNENLTPFEINDRITDNIINNPKRIINATVKGVLGGVGAKGIGQAVTAPFRASQNGKADFSFNEEGYNRDKAEAETNARNDFNRRHIGPDGASNIPILLDAFTTDSQYKQQEDILNTLVNVSDEKNNPDTTSQELVVLNQVQDSQEQSLREIVDENNYIIERLSEDEIRTTEQVSEEVRRLNNSIRSIEKSDRNDVTKTKYMSPLVNKKEKLYEQLNKIREEAKARPEPAITKVSVAPFYNKQVSNMEEAAALRESNDYKVYLETIDDAASLTGVTIQGIDQAIGGYFLSTENKAITEISNVVNVEADNLDQVVDFAALLGGLTPEVQEATIAGEEVEWESDRHNADVYSIMVSDPQKTLDALKKIGITEFTLNEGKNTLTLYDVHADRTAELDEKWQAFTNELEQNNVNYETREIKGADSRYIGEEERKQILQNVRERAAKQGPEGKVFRDKIEQAITGVAGKNIEKELTPEQKEVNEINELLGKKPKFSTQQNEQLQEFNIDQMVEDMNSMPAEVLNFTNPTNLSTTEKTNTEYLLKNFPEVNIIRDLQGDFKDLPMLFSISDELKTGDTTNPVTGTTHKLEGGSGFNKDGMAWANTTPMVSESLKNNALNSFSQNKLLFERAWDQGLLPYGHVPMAIIKMGPEGLFNNEAVYRYASDEIKTTIPERNRVNALKELVKVLKPRVGVNNKGVEIKKGNEAIYNFVSKYKTIDQVMDNITKLPITARKLIGEQIFTGNINKDTTPGKPTTPVKVALLKNVTSDQGKKSMHISYIKNQLEEPSTAKIPQRHVISIVGIDVLNPEVSEIDHKNYGYGIKGVPIGILESPVHAMDVFPEMTSRSMTLKGNNTYKNKTLNQRIHATVMANGPIAGFSGFQGIKMSDKVDNMRDLMSQLKLTFPNVMVTDTQQEFDLKVQDPSVTKFVKKGDIIYGFTKQENGSPVVYLNPKYKSTKVILHEYGHVWLEFLKQNNPELLAKGYSLLEGTEGLYKSKLIHGDTELAYEEAMAEAISNKGDSIGEASIRSRFLNWLNGVFSYIKSKFKAFSEMTSEEIQNMSLEDFVDGSLASMLDGDSKRVNEISKIKFSKSNLKETMEDLVKRRYSGAAIKEALSEDYGDKEILDAYKQAKSEYREEAYKNEGIFNSENNPLFQVLDKIHRSLLSSRGYKAKTQQIEGERMEGSIQASLKQAMVTSNKLVQQLKSSKASSEDLTVQINMILEGNVKTYENLSPETKLLSNEVVETVLDMRAQIDVLQKSLIDEGLLETLPQRIAITDGIGSYLTRSYRIFDSKNWNEELQAKHDGSKIITKAKNFFRNDASIKKRAQDYAAEEIMSYEQALDHTVNQAVNNILKKSDSSPYIKSSREGAKDANALKFRKDMPEPIMALMGVYTDPIQNYTRTIQRVSNLLEASRYLHSVRKKGLGVFLFEKNDPTAPPEYKYEIAPENKTGNGTYNPMAGLLTTQEIRDAMMAEPIFSGSFFNSPLYRNYLKLVSSVKYAKTIMSPGTHGKNVTGNLFFMAQNGYTSFKAYDKAFSIVKGQIKSRGETRIDSDLLKYIRLGIIDSSVVKKELMEMFNGDKEASVATLMQRRSERWFDANNTRKKVGKALQKAYQLEDDYFKIVSFEIESGRYALALFEKETSALSEEQKTEIEGIAAENTKNLLPNYNRIGQLRDLMRAIPVAGTFISFTMESYRTAYNTVALSLKEIKNPNPKVKKIGAKRLASIIGFQVLVHGVMIPIIGDLFGSDIDDEDEDDVKRYKRLVLPTWSRNSTTPIIKSGGGKFTYIDMSASNPYGQMDQAINAALSEEDAGQKAAEFIEEALGDFWNKDILFSAMSSVAQNEKPQGGTVWKDDDSYATRINKGVRILYKAFEPGIVRSAAKINSADNKLLEVLGQATGFKPIEVDYGKSMKFTARRIMNSTQNITSKSSLERMRKSGEITGEEYRIKNATREETKREMIKGLVDLYHGAIYFGLSPKEASKALEEGGVPGYMRSDIRRFKKIKRVNKN